MALGRDALRRAFKKDALYAVAPSNRFDFEALCAEKLKSPGDYGFVSLGYPAMGSRKIVRLIVPQFNCRLEGELFYVIGQWERDLPHRYAKFEQEWSAG